MSDGSLCIPVLCELLQSQRAMVIIKDSWTASSSALLHLLSERLIMYEYDVTQEMVKTDRSGVTCIVDLCLIPQSQLSRACMALLLSNESAIVIAHKDCLDVSSKEALTHLEASSDWVI